MKNQPFKLTKRFRHQEENSYLYNRLSWTKKLLNVEGGTVLSRTPMRWLLLIIFYILFYSGIIVFSFFVFYIFGETLTASRPKCLLPQPGLSFQPSVMSSNMNTNIEFHEHSIAEVNVYVDSIVESLRKFGGGINKSYYPCHNESDFYGYKTRNPCVFLKINRIIGFKTDPIENANDLPVEAPNELRKHLQNLSNIDRADRIWVSCDSTPYIDIGYHPQRYFSIVDVDTPQTIIQKFIAVEYIREHGLENSFFYNKDDYNRVIAVHLVNLQMHVNYNVHCFLWAKNIIHDVRANKGMVHFMIKIKQ